MADLLRTGNTMLNLSCPICHNPLFRNREKQIFCPICNREVQIVNEQLAGKNQESSNQESNVKNNIPKSNASGQNTIFSLERILTNKLEWISSKLESETQIELIEKEVRLINYILKTLNKLKKLID